MKKEYVQPKMKAVSVRASRMLCTSDQSFSITNDSYVGAEGIDVD